MTLDAIVCTGDLCSTQSEAEFVAAQQFFEHCTHGRAGFVVPGNHDTNTRDGTARSFEKHFGRWMPAANTEGFPTRLDIGPVTLVGIDQSPGSMLRSSGHTGTAQLAQLHSLLSDPSLDQQIIVLCEHYPWIHANGTPFNRRGNRLIDLTATQQAVMSAQYAPHVLLHGHVHDGWTASLNIHHKPIITSNPGGGAVEFSQHSSRSAAFHVYQFDWKFPDQSTLTVEEYKLGEQGFSRRASRVFALRL